MSISTVVRPAVHAALDGFIDYAGLFPPATLALAPAIEEYAAAGAGPYAWMLGRFVISASALAAHADAARELSVCVVVDAAPADGAWLDGVRGVFGELAAARTGSSVSIQTIELTLPPQAQTHRAPIPALHELVERSGLRDARVYVEIPRAMGYGRRPAMEDAARTGFGVKLRCGGTTADAFPSVDDVADFITDAVAANVPFKATAGLHHPVRHVDAATGFYMHGFLNLLAAAALAPRVDRETMGRIVAEEDARAFHFTDDALQWRDLEVATSEIERTRRALFHAYGSCSFSEPVEDLVALNVLPSA